MSRVLLPEGWKRPPGYSHGIEARGRMVFVAGQIGAGADGVMVGRDLPAQARQALKNIVTVLAGAGAGPRDIVRMTWYVVDMDEYRRTLGPLGEVYRAIMGGNYPAMTLVGVSRLVEPEARVEIEATAVVAEREG